MAGGVERVLTLKANYFVEHFDYDITIITTDGQNKQNFFPLSDKVHVVNLNINFEQLWNRSFLIRVYLYLCKQKRFKKLLTTELNNIKPDITVSLLRREINFINSIKDGSKKIGEIHINRAFYRNFTPNRSNLFRHIFSKYWMHGLVDKVKKLDRFVVLTEYDRQAWQDVPSVDVIPNPLPFYPKVLTYSRPKRVLVVGRYFDEKGYDLLLKAWSFVEKQNREWVLDIYGDGSTSYYERMITTLSLDRSRCRLHGCEADIQRVYLKSSFLVCSSRFEGFGMGIIEAMACGLPVVAFDCLWGPRSIISNGEDGILVENGNVKRLADAILMLMNCPEKITVMGRKAHENVLRFDIERIAEKWKKLFDSL